MDWSQIDLRMVGALWNQAWQNAGITPPLLTVINWVVAAVVLLLVGLNMVIGLIWLERKIAARIQDRLGPNRVGPFGLLQTVADALKLLTKEDITPTEADRITYNLAPALAVFHVLMTLAVIPFADGVIGADLNVGVLYIVAFGSLGSMAALMAGWASNNKYALVGGFRVVAQLLSYEIPLVFAMMIPVLVAGTMRMNGLAQAQGQFGGLGWYGWVMPCAFFIFLAATLAEGERAPFDLLEAESEIVAGFNIEYSGMKFAWFFLAFFLNSWVLSAIGTTLFLGGWQGPFVDRIPALGVVYFFAKTMVMFWVLAWIRATFPRLRIDQMMDFCWKFLVPLALVLLVGTAILLKLGLPSPFDGLALLVWNLVLLIGGFWLLGKAQHRAVYASKRAFTPQLPRL
jgi:NADH-quinone oxidoreductase subunit H